MLNIAIGLDGISMDSLMLLDSGADNIVLPGKAVSVLGVSSTDCKPASGSMYYGPSEAFWSPPLTISLPDLNERFSFETEVLFAPRLDAFEYGLLGREPTLNHLRVGFTHEVGPSFFLAFKHQ